MLGQFREPCWVLVIPDVPSDLHYPTYAEAVAGDDVDPRTVYRRPELCWRIVCDGCGNVRTTVDDEGYECEHYYSRGDAVAAQRELGALCEDCEAAAALGSVATPTGAVAGLAAPLEH